jgi:hypothetical protein
MTGRYISFAEWILSTMAEERLRSSASALSFPRAIFDR